MQVICRAADMTKSDSLRWSRRDLLKVGGTCALGLTLVDRLWPQAAEQPLPARQPADRIDGPPVVSAKAWAIADGKSGRLLWGAREAVPLSMASTTKIMTAWLVVQLAGRNPKVLDEVIAISERAAKTTGSSAGIRPGDRFVARDLLYGLLLPSGNDAAVALAEHFGDRHRPGNDPTPPLTAFVAEMNRQAKTLRMGETRYFDPHGLGKNQTSARDLTTLASNGMQNPLFRQYVQTRRHRCEAQGAKDQKRTVVWNNTNRLLEIEGYDGIKTGTTNAAGFCLVASGRHNSDHLLVVVLGATSNDSRYVDTRNLFRWAWSQRGRKPG
jgi:D-alanyl-D-alanine carboxypeptidase (penicillin-binding protein 5/6)